MKTKLTFITLLLMAGFTMFAQKQVEQQGYVRSIGRPDNKYGERLGGATIRVSGQHNDVRSNDNGDFTITFDDATVGVTTYSLSRVRLAGYEVNEKEVIGRQFAVSAKVPHEIVMVSLAVKQAIEDSITARIDRRYKTEYAKLEREKEQLGEEYHARLQKLFDEYDKRDQLISEMVERYANTDYAKLDSTAAKINAYIETGELEKADSIIRAMDVTKMESEYKMVREDNDRLRAKLNKGEKAQENLYQNLYTAYNGKYEIFAQQFMNDSAAFYLEKIVELDTTNVENLLRAGEFIKNNLADYYKTKKYYDSALSIALDLYGEENEWTANCYNNLGSIYSIMEDYDKALCYYEKALQIRLSNFGERYVEVATGYNNIGYIYECYSKYSEALEFYMKALDIWLSNYGEDCDDVVRVYDNIGVNLNHQHRFDEAMEYFNKALNIGIKLHGENHCLVASLYNNIGMNYGYTDKLYESLQYKLKAAEIFKIIYGENHPYLAYGYQNIGSVYDRLKSFDKALCFYNKALNIRLLINGENHSNVGILYNNIGCVYIKTEEFDKALNFLFKSMDVYKTIGMSDSEAMGTTIGNIGYVYYVQKNYDKALDYYKQSNDINMSLLGENHPSIAINYSKVGSVYAKMGKYKDAIGCFDKALEIRISIYGENHSSVGECYNNIGYVNYMQKKYSDALYYYRKDMVIDSTLFGMNSADVALGFKNIGLVYYDLADYYKALECLNKSLKIRRSIYGDNHSSVGLVVSSIFTCYTSLAATEPSYSDTISDFLSTKLFVAQFPVDSTSKSELQGELYLLQLDDWNMETVGNVFDLNKSLNGKKKNVVLYKDGKVLNRKLDKKTGFDIILREVGKDEHDEVIDAWRKTIKRN